MDENRTKAKITYRGWAGHFICGHRCQFRLNTLVELGEVRIVVSTVGLLPAEGGLEKSCLAENGFLQIGFDRHFETMCFHAKKKDEFWDADVSREVDFDAPSKFGSIEDEWLANKNHLRVVEEIAKRMEGGEWQATLTD